METLYYSIIEICIAIASTGIMALIVFLLKRTIKKIYFGNDLLPASRIPNIDIELFDGEHWDANNVSISTLSLSNKGELGVSNIKVFCYKHIMNEDKMVIRLLSKGIDYQWTNSGFGERVSISLKNLNQFFTAFDATEGLFIEMIDEYDTVFCQTVFIDKDENNYLIAIPQTIKRLKKSLPERKIAKNPSYLFSKYGVDISVG